MENKNNFAGIIIPVIVAVILLTVLPIVNSINKECPPCEECPSYNIGNIEVNPNFSSGDYIIDKGSYDYIDSATIIKDVNLLPENIKKGVTIFGITGTYEEEPIGFTLAIVCDCRGYTYPYPLYYSIDDGASWVYIADAATSYKGTVILNNITQIKIKLYIDYDYEDGCWLKVGTTVGGSDLYHGTGHYTLSELISPNIPITSNTVLYVSSYGAD